MSEVGLEPTSALDAAVSGRKELGGFLLSEDWLRVLASGASLRIPHLFPESI